MKKEIENLKKDYINFFSEVGYQQNKEVKISSGIDKSVVFVGSTISILKPKLLNDDIDNPGDFLIQRAIRTRGLKRIDIPEKNEWSSYFDASGILVPYANLEKLVYDTIEFLNKIIGFDYENIMIRISSDDLDLIKSLRNINDKVLIEFDSKPQNYYKHKYGLQDMGIYGRNFNIAIRNVKDNKYKDIGNIIVIESNEKKYGAECAIGLNSILMRKLELDTSIEASSVVDIYNVVSPEDFKFADCLSVVSNLAYENVSSLSDRSPNYLYRKYLRHLFQWGDIMGISNDRIFEMIKDYILLEYGDYEENIINSNVNKVLSRGGYKYGRK